MSTKPVKIGIVGAGVGGSVAAVRLASMFRAAEVVLMEKTGDILGGPPFCHLHSGGMLYTTMTDEEARTILHHACWFAEWFPGAIQHRPTIITARSDVAGPGLNGDDLVEKCDKGRYIYM